MAHLAQSNAASRKPNRPGKIKPPQKARYGPGAVEELWNFLETSIQEIHKHNAHQLSFEENYRYAYNMCMQQATDKLYHGVCKLVSQNLDRLAKEIIVPAFPSGTVGGGDSTLRAQEGEQFLKAVRLVWEEHIQNMSKLKDVLKYMDRMNVNNAKARPIFDQGVQLFLERVVNSQHYTIKAHLLSTLLSQIQIERDGYTINRSAVKGCVEVLMEIRDRNNRDPSTVYKKEFEPVFLRETESFYQLEGEKLLESCDASEYLRRVESRFNQERSRTQYYLSSATEAPLISILENHLLSKHLNAVVSMKSSGLDAMIDGNKDDDIARMYRLFITVPEGLGILKKELKESIMRRGTEINSAGGPGDAADGGDGEGEDAEEPPEDPKAKGSKKKPSGKGSASRAADTAIQWVQSVLDLKDRYERLLKFCFADDLAVQTTIGDAFETFINTNKKSPEYISLFIDDNLRKGLKGKSDQEVDVVLEKTITVFRYINERDVFERYYKNHLSKRLLQGRSVSDDAERGMLAKLKVECGVQFTQKLEGMFNDLRISSEHMIGYRDHLNKPHVEVPSVDLVVNVLTSTFWPISLTPATPCIWPPELDQAAKAYERFYLSRHTGRRLTWQPSMGSADVRVQFKARTHDLNVSTYALVILLLFENLGEGDILTYEEIQNATGIAEAELQRQLQSLACAKFRVLKKHPPGRDVHPDDSFSFNHAFTCPMQRIKIATVIAKVENVEERKETMEKIDEERKHQVDAYIVRIMKDRKVLSHIELVNETTRQLLARFHPSPADIKKRIESLIEREYLDRCEDKKSYKYVA